MPTIEVPYEKQATRYLNKNLKILNEDDSDSYSDESFMNMSSPTRPKETAIRKKLNVNKIFVPKQDVTH